MSTTRKNFLTKKVIIVVAVLSVGALSAIIVASSLSQATAQEQKRMMMSSFGEGIPQINGSVNVTNEASSFINENVKVSFVAAAQTAQGQVTNGTVLGGHLGVLQGYLVYTFFVTNFDNQTEHMVVVDGGNGSVLYTSEGQAFGAFDHPMMLGSWNGNSGFGEWHGPWKPFLFGGGLWH